MRKLWPFVGIALAVAGGIALAPYFWWIAILCAVVGVGFLTRREWPRVWSVLWMLGALAIVAAWPGWLLWRGQTADAVFAVLLVLLIASWRSIVAWARPVWRTMFPD
jgi:hypothetical protein